MNVFQYSLQIVFVFTRGVSTDVAESLNSLGITVKTENNLGEHVNDCNGLKTMEQGSEKIKIPNSENVPYEQTDIPWVHMKYVSVVHIAIEFWHTCYVLQEAMVSEL